MLMRVVAKTAAIWALSLIVCASVDAGAEAKTLTYGSAAGPSTLDPHMAGATVDYEVTVQIYESLMGLDESYNPKPMLASKVEVSPDAKTFTFTLRKGVKFQNGKEMTSADVLASFRRYKRISPNAVILDGVENFSSTGPYDFTIQLKQPNAVFLNIIATPLYSLGILPAEQEQKPGREADVIGTGPFKLGTWVKDSHLELVKFADYAQDESGTARDGLVGRKNVLVDNVMIKFLPETNVRVSALLAGDIDIASSLSSDSAKRIENDKKFVLIPSFPNSQGLFVLNSQNGPTANVAIRQAIEAVVDAEEVVAATGQLSKLNPSMLYATSPYYDVPSNKGHYSLKDPARAKQKLAEAGYKGEKIILQTNSNYSFMRDAILVLSELMKAAGMNADVQVVDWTTNSNNMQRGTGNWNVSTTGFGPAPLLGPQQWRNQMYNFAQIKNDDVMDKAFEKFFTTLDVEGRKQAWSTIQQNVFDKAYFIKIADYGFLSARKSAVTGMGPWLINRLYGVAVD
jgi:peptide/nickel transport system substrate-binding protein